MAWWHRPCRHLVLQIVVDMLTSPSWLRPILPVGPTTDRQTGSVLFTAIFVNYCVSGTHIGGIQRNCVRSCENCEFVNQYFQNSVFYMALYLISLIRTFHLNQNESSFMKRWLELRIFDKSLSCYVLTHKNKMIPVVNVRIKELKGQKHLEILFIKKIY